MPRTAPTTAQPRDPWMSAVASLSEEDRMAFSGINSNILEDLKAVSTALPADLSKCCRTCLGEHDQPSLHCHHLQIQQATEDKKRVCEEKSWKIYTKKTGQKVTIRHLLEKLSVWVTESIKIVDTFISFDVSGHAAIPWAIIKFVITVCCVTPDHFSS